MAGGDLDPFGPQFAVGLFDCWGAHPLKTIKQEFQNIMRLNIKFWINIVLAPWTFGRVLAWLNKSERAFAYAIPSLACYLLCIALHILEIFFEGCYSVAWFFYLCFVAHATAVRIQCREKLGIIGNPFEDFFAGLFFYPNVAVQLEETISALDNCTNSKANIHTKTVK